MTRKRDYDKEYRDYHAKPEQIANRAARNKARSDAVAAGQVHKGDGLEIDHKRPLSKGGSKTAASNRQVLTRTANRKKGARV